MPVFEDVEVAMTFNVNKVIWLTAGALKELQNLPVRKMVGSSAIAKDGRLGQLTPHLLAGHTAADRQDYPSDMSLRGLPPSITASLRLRACVRCATD